MDEVFGRDSLSILHVRGRPKALTITCVSAGKPNGPCEGDATNRARRTGYKVIRVPARGGGPTGEYEDFMTGVTPAGEVWGRPVGVAEAKDGALFVSDDGSNTIWRVTYTGE